MSDPSYVKLDPSYGGELIYDRESGFVLAGVKPFPSDGGEASFVRNAIAHHKIASATRDEWEAANPPGPILEGNFVSVGTDYGAPIFANGWTSPDLAAGATTGIGAPKFEKMNGLVHLVGLIAGGANGTVAFVLPEGFRPGIGNDDFSPSFIVPIVNIETFQPGTCTVAITGDGSVRITNAMFLEEILDESQVGTGKFNFVPVSDELWGACLNICFPVLR